MAHPTRPSRLRPSAGSSPAPQDPSGPRRSRASRGGSEPTGLRDSESPKPPGARSEDPADDPSASASTGWAAEFPTLAADRVLRAALEEDVGTGDVTTLATVPAGTRVRAYVVAKEPLRLAGVRGFVRTFELLGGNDLSWEFHADDGDDVAAGTRVLDVEGDARLLLTGERTALNLLQRLSGIATMTARWCRRLAGTKARLVDTRKTTPGLRALEKYAVRVGGARNHRTGLFDGVLLKENHLRAAGGIAAAVAAARDRAPHTLRVEVEVTTLAELDQALAAGADAVLLDNMDLAAMAEAVKKTAGRALLEASGGVSEERLAAIAATGVDLISAGALTHSARAVDLSFLFESQTG